MVVASLTPPGVDTLLAALLRGERVTLPLIDQVALFFGLIVANLTRDFVAHLSEKKIIKICQCIFVPLNFIINARTCFSTFLGTITHF